MPEFSRPLGDVVKRARDKQELTQAQVADSIDIDMRTVLNIENYKGNPKLEVLYPLVRTLKIDPNEIFYPERFYENSDTKYLHLIIDTCSEQETATLVAVIEPLLTALRTNNSTPINK